MDTQALNADRLRSSVIAVPPLARNQQLEICPQENQRLIKYLEAGGITILLYGGNANLYHVRYTEYRQLLSLLAELAGPQTLMIPSIGPSFGLMLDQVEVLRDFPFPTAMVLPMREIVDSAGIATGIRLASERLGRPLVLYLKHAGFVHPLDVRKLMEDGCLSFIKYAVVRDDPAEDGYLSDILQQVPASLVVSGMGEQPAITHLRQFKLAGFTSGCVCIAPRHSQAMLRAIQKEELARAETIRQHFVGLEDLRNAISPIRVLHRAVALAKIADTGPMLPLLSEIDSFTEATVIQECQHLLKYES